MKFLLCGDLHTRLDILDCRIDDFLAVQKQTLLFIAAMAKKHNAVCLCAGDIFNRAKSKNNEALIILLADIFKNIKIYFIAGNHDLINHSFSYFDISSIGVLSRFDNWYYQKEKEFKNVYIRFFNFNEKIENTHIQNKIKIAVLHKYVSQKDVPFYVKDKGIAAEILIKNYNYDYYITGDNHQSFIYEKNNKFVINCGCITRQKFNEKNYKPKIYLLDITANKIDSIMLPDQLDVIKNNYMVVTQEDRVNKIDSFIELCQKQDFNFFNYEDNLLYYCQKNNINEVVKTEIENILFYAKNTEHISF